MEEAVDNLRVPARRVEADGNDGKFEAAGEKAGRVPLGDGVLRCS